MSQGQGSPDQTLPHSHRKPAPSPAPRLRQPIALLAELPISLRPFILQPWQTNTPVGKLIHLSSPPGCSPFTNRRALLPSS